jgi:hypothetical protein
MIEETEGHGYFKMFSSIVVLTAIKFCTLLLHALPFLLQYPDYECFDGKTD